MSFCTGGTRTTKTTPQTRIVVRMAYLDLSQHAELRPFVRAKVALSRGVKRGFESLSLRHTFYPSPSKQEENSLLASVYAAFPHFPYRLTRLISSNWTPIWRRFFEP